MYAVRLDPLTISQYSKVLLASLIASFPDHTESQITDLYGALTTGALTGWALLSNDQGKLEFVGLSTTFTYTPSFSGPKTLCIYSLTAYKHVALQAWDMAYQTIEAHAKAMGCTRVEAITVNPRVDVILKHLGFGEPKRLFGKDV